MRVLLDECVPRKLKNHLPEHECTTVPDAGFTGTKNGELLKLAQEAGFEVFLTPDRGIEYQQNLKGRKIAVLIVRSTSSRLEDLVLSAIDIGNAIHSIRNGQIVRIEK